MPPCVRDRQLEPTSVTFWMSRRNRVRLLDALSTLHKDRSRALLSLVRTSSKASRVR
jgi:hypothetical protein